MCVRPVALVTGSSRGIGAAIADALADAGHAIAITYASSQEAAEARVAALQDRGVTAAAFHLDGNDAESVASLVPRVAEALGPIQVLVNNAGTVTPAVLSDTSDQAFDQQYAVNVRTPFQLARAAAEQMDEGGRIINIGSIWGQSVPMPGIGAYAMSKFALTGLTRAWARDLAGQGITVNCVHPGPIHTDMNPSDGPFAGFNTPRTALGRYGRAEELARAVVWLASPESSYVTGAELNVDGGYNA
ncbi:MAG: SDR family oxidoreductase [Myxococcota bacterium]